MGEVVTGKLRIKRDGKLVAEVDDRIQAIAWLHQHTPQSYDWALKHEGYTVENADGTPALEPYTK